MTPIWYPSPNFGYPQGSPGRNGHWVKAIVVHRAAGSCATLIRQAETPGKPITTYAVCKDGRALQFVRESDAAWGNGQLSNPDRSVPWIDYCVINGINPNFLTISCEAEGSDPEPLTPPQYRTMVELFGGICERWGIYPDKNGLVGHNSITATFCPGPSMPLDQLRRDLLGPPDLTDLQKTALYASLVTIYAGQDDARHIATTPPDLEDLDEIVRRQNAIKIRYGLENGP